MEDFDIGEAPVECPYCGPGIVCTNQHKICGRCYDDVDELFEAKCDEKPEALAGAPLGMYHCPDCGAMVLAGLPHPELCKLCVNKQHPGFDWTENDRQPRPE